jgi:hypothetical protein
VRLLLVATAALLLTSCAPAPRPLEQAKADPPPDLTQESGYGAAVEQLAGKNRKAEALLKSGKSEEAAKIITGSQPLLTRLLSVPRPTLAAMEAVSDCDEIYGRMLFANRHYGWARLAFQKNVTRWKAWKPQTAGTADRLKAANDAIAECDRRLSGR